MSTFNLETATVDELIDEILRITITDYKKLGARMNCDQMSDEERAIIAVMLEKYRTDQKLLDVYFERLEDMFKDSPPGQLEKELKDKQMKVLKDTEEP